VFPPEHLDIVPEETTPNAPPLKGEVAVFRDVEAYFRSPLGPRVLGTLAATTYQLRFTPAGGIVPHALRHLPPGFLCVPVAGVRRVEKVLPKGGREAGAAFLVELTCKDCRVLTLGFRDEATADKMAGHIRMIAFPPRLEFLHAFADVPAPVVAAAAAAATPASGREPPPATNSAVASHHALPGWDVFNPYRELDRMGVLRLAHPRTREPLWRVSDLNREYAYCPTYPSVLVFPERVPDAALQAVGGFRSKARVPALTWVHPANKTTMWRSSQPRVGMGNNTCAADEALLAAIRDANVYSRDPAAPLLIADCRPRANAMANRAGGWGYEVNYANSQLEFLGIHNIHAVRDGYRKVEALAQSPRPDDVDWAAGIAESGWLYHLRTVLSGALYVAEAMHRRGQSVLVHCR
jgi:hypothetical protein